jgi:hypothetical protein
MHNVDEASVYEQFLAAREEAILLTDRFASCPREDPKREELWDIAMRQTETARLLLEEWLRLGKLNPQRAPAAAVTDRPLPPAEVELRPLEASFR